MSDIFENIQEKFDTSISSQEYKNLLNYMKRSDIVIVTGNGGNYSIASHAASDVTRLTNKFVISMDSMSYFSSVANFRASTCFEVKVLQHAILRRCRCAFFSLI